MGKNNAPVRKGTRETNKLPKTNLELYQTVLQRSPALIAVYNITTGQYIYVSDSLKKLLGYPKATFLKKGLAFASSLVHPEDLGRIMQQNQQALLQANNNPHLDNQLQTFEYRMLHKNGSWRWIRSDGIVFDRDNNGRVLHVLNISFDITEKKQIEQEKERAEAMIRASESEYKKLIELSPMPIAVHSMGKLLYVNNAGSNLIGAKDPEELIGRNILDFVHPDYHELVKKRAEAVYKEKKLNTEIVEEKFIRLDGQEIYVEVSSLLFHYEGKPAVQVLMRDITQQKSVEEELRQREERFRLLVQNSSDIISVFSADGTILYQSPSIKRALGRLPEDRIGKNVFDNEHIHPDDRSKRHAMLLKTLARPKEMVKAEFRVRHTNGTWRTIEAVCQNFVNDPRIGGVIGNYRDITERKAVEEIINSERYKVMAILASTSEGIYGTDTQGNCTFINPSLLQLLGYKEKECLGKNVSLLFHHRDPKNATYPYAEFPIFRSLTTGQSTRLAEDIIWTKSGQVIQILLSCSPIKEDAQITGSVITVIDIRERKKLERQKDEFIGIASHELKTPVTSIKAYAQVLQKRFKKAGDEQSAAFLTKMDAQLDKLTNLIKDLLDVTKIESGKLELKKAAFDVNELISEVVEEMQRTTENHVIEKRLAKTISLKADRDRIGQVLINLISNAIKYSPGSKKIVVTTHANADQIVTSVQDFGVGITKEGQKKVFERFFRGTNKEQASYPGLGLGLYISKEIIQRHNGKIWVESQKGKGTTFSYSLPFL